MKKQQQQQKKAVKRDEFFSGDQYFSPTNNFTQLKLTPTKNFYQLFFHKIKSQITEHLKKLSDLLYHTLVEWRLVGKGSYSDNSSEEEDLNIDVNFDESTDLVIN